MSPSENPPSPGNSIVPSPQTGSADALRQGDEDAAVRLVERYSARLRELVRTRCSPQLARLLDPEDIIQSVFRRFFQQLADPEYGIPAGEELWLLLLTITLNRLRSAETYHRAKKRDLRRTVGSTEETQWIGSSGRSSVEEDLEVEETLEQLSPRYRTVVRLRLAGYGVAEIAEQLGRSHRTVERLFEEIRKQLGELLHA
jgi:RNA polymerase sigma-70 factor (ECF subfamily)